MRLDLGPDQVVKFCDTRALLIAAFRSAGARRFRFGHLLLWVISTTRDSLIIPLRQVRDHEYRNRKSQ